MAYTAAVFFVDYEGGSDAARTALTGCVISNPSGSQISVNKTAHGLVAGAIFDATLFTAWFNSDWKVLSVTDADNFIVDGVWQAAADANGTITPRGGSSKADAWKTLNSGASSARIQPGDTIRVMATPAATSLGVSGAWTDGPLLAASNIVSSTNATPIVMTFASPPADGDTITVAGHTTNTNANGTWPLAGASGNTAQLVGSVGNGVGGATGTYRKVNNCVVTLASAVGGDNVACPRDGESGGQGTKTNWTASASVTCTVVTSDFKQGAECQQIAIAAGFTTGLAAYRALASAKDYSGRQQLTFWIKQTAGTIGAAGATRLRLCSDAAGATPVDSFDVPSLGVLNAWVPVCVNKGSALGSSIQSVSFDVVTDNGAQTFLIDCIRTVNSVASADSLSLVSLIGKNTTGESWLAIQSIVGTRVYLDQHNNSLPNNTTSASRGYSGTTETVTTYKREPWLAVPETASTSGPSTFSANESGTELLPITYSWGWDRTSMALQTGETWISGQNGQGLGFGNQSQRDYVRSDGTLGLSRFNFAYSFAGASIAPAFGNLHVNNNSGRAVNSAGCLRASGAIKSCRNNQAGGALLGVDNCNYSEIVALSNDTSSVTLSGNNGGLIANCVVHNAGPSGYGLSSSSSGCQIKNLSTSGNQLGAVQSTSGILYLKDAAIGESLEFSVLSGSDGKVISENHDSVSGNSQIAMDGGLISSESAIRDTASGYSWAVAVTSLNRNVNYPLHYQNEAWAVAVAANALVTMTLRMYRTNTGLTFKFGVKGGQLSGVAADVFSSAAGSAGAWETVTITFTPTEAGVIQPRVEAYGGTTFIGYFDNFTVSQA